jgi:hypothetical protein
MLSVKVLQSGDIYACAQAAAMSYNKDISAMSGEETEAYVKRIWDKHTNVSEHFVARLEFTDIPRLATLLFAFQRDGITITEMSQRRCKPNETTEEYETCIENGAKLEDARKCLPVSTPSRFVVTLNRESARNMARIFQCYERICVFREILKPLGIPDILAHHFMFNLDIQYPFNFPAFLGVIDLCKPIGSSKISDNLYEFVMPMYSFHQFCRHRKILLISWCVAGEPLYNDTLVSVMCRSFHWKEFAETRSGNDTQEPLRTIARGVYDNER